MHELVERCRGVVLFVRCQPAAQHSTEVLCASAKAVALRTHVLTAAGLSQTRRPKSPVVVWPFCSTLTLRSGPGAAELAAGGRHTASPGTPTPPPPDAGTEDVTKSREDVAITVTKSREDVAIATARLLTPRHRIPPRQWLSLLVQMHSGISTATLAREHTSAKGVSVQPQAKVLATFSSEGSAVVQQGNPALSV